MSHHDSSDLFFGQFLTHKGVVTEEELALAIEYQKNVNLRFGRLAVQKGYLNQEDAEKVFLAQKEQDLCFGDCAMKLGLLTRAQVDELLFIQTVSSTHLGEALLELGFISQPQFSALLQAYGKQQSEREERVCRAMRAIDPDSVMRSLVLSVERALNRFVSEKVKLKSVCEPFDQNNFDLRFDLSIPFQDGRIMEIIFLLDQELLSQSEDQEKNKAEQAKTRLSQFRELMRVVERYFSQALVSLGRAPGPARIDGGPLIHFPAITSENLPLVMRTFGAAIGIVVGGDFPDGGPCKGNSA